MSDTDKTTGWQRTYRATAIVTPITHIGSRDDCQSWCSTMLGQEVWITDANGMACVVGLITQTKSENADGF